MKHVMQWSVTKYFIISSSCSTRSDSINCAPSFRLDIDVPRLLRFSLFGSLWVAPSLYLWVRLSGKIITGTTLGSAALKAFIEQFTYGPFSITTFYIGMNLLEGNETRKAVEEAKTKFVPTWKVISFYKFPKWSMSQLWRNQFYRQLWHSGHLCKPSIILWCQCITEWCLAELQVLYGQFTFHLWKIHPLSSI